MNKHKEFYKAIERELIDEKERVSLKQLKAMKVIKWKQIINGQERKMYLMRVGIKWRD